MDKHQQDLDNITLQFFANSLYNVDLEKTDCNFSLQEKKFYKKRIILLTKQMLKEKLKAIIISGQKILSAEE